MKHNVFEENNLRVIADGLKQQVDAQTTHNEELIDKLRAQAEKANLYEEENNLL